MFHANRWAAAFVGAAGDKAEEGFGCLRAMVPAVNAVPGALFGHSAARRLEKILREGVSAASITANAGAEWAIRFITMLVEKNSFGNIDTVLQRIEKILDEQKGILNVTAESAFPPDEALKEEFRRQIAGRTGAAEIKMNWRLVPELLGGYRLRIGAFYVDASLKGQVEKLSADLEAAVVTVTAGTAPGGGI